VQSADIIFAELLPGQSLTLARAQYLMDAYRKHGFAARWINTNAPLQGLHLDWCVRASTAAQPESVLSRVLPFRPLPLAPPDPTAASTVRGRDAPRPSSRDSETLIRLGALPDRAQRVDAETVELEVTRIDAWRVDAQRPQFLATFINNNVSWTDWEALCEWDDVAGTWFITAALLDYLEATPTALRVVETAARRTGHTEPIVETPVDATAIVERPKHCTWTRTKKGRPCGARAIQWSTNGHSISGICATHLCKECRRCIAGRTNGLCRKCGVPAGTKRARGETDEAGDAAHRKRPRRETAR
jgi:hypothetical protein